MRYTLPLVNENGSAILKSVAWKVLWLTQLLCDSAVRRLCILQTFQSGTESVQIGTDPAGDQSPNFAGVMGSIPNYVVFTWDQSHYISTYAQTQAWGRLSAICCQGDRN